MDSSKEYHRSGGVLSPLFAAVVLLAVAKLVGVPISWAVVLAPLWVFGIILVLILSIVIGIIGAITS